MESDNYLDYGVTKAPKLGSQSILGGGLIHQQALPPLVYEIDFPDNMDVPHLLTGGTVLASERFINLLKTEAVDNFQAFPVEILNPVTGKRRNEFYLFNVVGLVKASDMTKSTYDELMAGSSDGIETPLVAFNEIVIDCEKTMGLSMFRLAEDPTALIVSENIVEALSDNLPENGWGIDVIELKCV
jgi:hypothetical protein